MLNTKAIQVFFIILLIINVLWIDSADAFFRRKKTKNENSKERLKKKTFFNKIKNICDFKKKQDPPSLVVVSVPVPSRKHPILPLINRVRSQVNLPPSLHLKWSEKLQKDAEWTAEKCKNVTFNDSRVWAYSQNYLYTGTKTEVEEEEVVKAWKEGCKKICLSSPKLGTAYNNMVRQDMRYVGCGRNWCEEQQSLLIICYFTPYAIL